jgi:release factor glutamine methyltransferase
MVLTVATALRAAVARLVAAERSASKDKDTPSGASELRAEAETLLAHVLGRDRTALFTHANATLDDAHAAQLETLLARRIAGEPVAYLTGTRGFWTFDLAVTPDTLIPRADTERLVELVLERLPLDAPRRVLDLGTGTGAIALAIAAERPLARVVAVDASARAAAVARHNAEALGLAARVAVREGSWFAPVVGGRFDVIASNPPYIEDADPHLAEGDLRFEPRSALASGADGLDDLRLIVQAAPAHLTPFGWLLVEHGWRQGVAVRALFDAAGFNGIGTARDLEARERVTFGRLGD